MRVAIYNLNFSALGGGERQTCALAAHLASKHHVVMFVGSPVSTEVIKAAFDLDLSDVEIIPLEHKDHYAEIKRRRPDLFINNSHGINLPSPAQHGIYMCMFPSFRRIDSSYKTIVANSQFTAKWIKRRWGRPSEVVYSACPDMGPSASKEKIILNVARFFADRKAHHKRQDSLLHAFRQMVDEGLCDWELHLVGHVGPSNEDAEYVAWLKNAALNYPIHIHTGIEFNELRHLYQKSAIYWHATGLGTFEVIHPDRQEHFGISIVEAMSAGVVPVVIDKGGPREIIKHGVNGFLWNNLSELKALSMHLIRQPQSLRKISRVAAIDSRTFSASEFLGRMDQVINRTMASEPDVTRVKGYLRNRLIF